jgi:misacylated tRNA(Ala) deacylase
MTDKLYLKDMYLKEFDASVVKVDGNTVILDKTAFYPTGGGQPNDTGSLIAKDKHYKVVDVKKEGEEVIHILDNADGIAVGDYVHGVINWPNRYAYMRYHTAIHLIDGVVQNNFGSKGFVTGSQIYADKARMDFDMPELQRGLAQEIIDRANDVVKEGRNVVITELPREQALKMPNLVRTEPGRELIQKLDVVRIVEIQGLDMQMDGGLHVLNTSEIGLITLGEFTNKGSRSKRIEVKLV